ncbi:hypothetical protein DFH08DRAFT_931882 [Mycena albidolilacea]|uniref:Uncharacterized protein n=1 Tax=Mycena albidolilacea TaxID=1033008 RepID=A0AAD7EZ22_9AGAR|nr:hypothetical protein DFH08DRAFT_931882 [Mycena albidolilacea]
MDRKYTKAAPTEDPEAALAALKLYEKAASAERDARMSLLQGREPPSVGSNTQPVVLPSASNSLLLPTDPEAIGYPDKTLESVSATGGFVTETCNELRWKCKLLPWACSALTTRRRTGQNGLIGAGRQSHGAPASGAHQPRPEFQEGCTGESYQIPTPAESLPAQKQHGYNRVRMYGAVLRPSAAAQSNILNILVNVEFTKTEAPTVASNPLIGASANVAKYRQAITNAVGLLTFQPTRLFVPTLSFHGKEEKTTLFISIPSQERLEFAIVPNCFNSKGFPLSRPSYTFSELRHYTSSATTLSLSTTSLPTCWRCCTRFRHSSRHSGTIVLEGALDEQSPHNTSTPVVVTSCFISDRRQWRESIVVNALYTADPEHPPAYAPKLLGAFAALGPPSVGSSSESSANLPMRKRKASVLDVLALVPRHLEVMLFASPRHSRKLKDLSVAEFLTAVEQLFEAILDAFPSRPPFSSRSTGSSADTLRSCRQLSCGGTVTGTLVAMSVASLRNDNPLPHNDMESAVYVLNALTQTFVPPVDQQRKWVAALQRCLRTFGRAYGPAVTVHRQFLPLCGFSSRSDMRLVPSSSSSLLSLPLPAKRQAGDSPPSKCSGINSADDDVILLSLEDFVKTAVDAVRSVDAS